MAPDLSAEARQFLERSLLDLDRERDAGDLSETDHRRLRGDYERRLRGEAPPPRPAPRRGLVAASAAFVVVVAVAAGVLVARNAGRRADGGTITGGGPVATAVEPSDPADPVDAIDPDLAACRALDGSEAIDCYTDYTDAHPDDPDGFTEFGLFAINAGNASDSDELLDAGEAFLRRALELDADDVAPRVYLAVLLERTGRTDDATAECTTLADVDIPADLQPLVDLACP